MRLSVPREKADRTGSRWRRESRVKRVRETCNNNHELHSQLVSLARRGRAWLQVGALERTWRRGEWAAMLVINPRSIQPNSHSMAKWAGLCAVLGSAACDLLSWSSQMLGLVVGLCCEKNPTLTGSGGLQPVCSEPPRPPVRPAFIPALAPTAA